MAKLEWRVSKGNSGVNIADFMDTAFIIEFDGPGTFCGYVRDRQSVRIDRQREYSQAVMWCQKMADQLEAEINAENESEVEKDPAYKASLEAATNFASLHPILNVAMMPGAHARFVAELAEVIFGARIAGVEESRDIADEVSEDHQRDCDPELSSGAFSVKRALERRIRILHGEDAAAVDRDMNK